MLQAAAMKVLLIEDSKLLQRSVGTALKKAGYAVDVTGDGKEGLWYAESNPYDAIILDLMLPGMDGLTLLHRLRTQGKNTHVLILTAKDTVADRVRGLQSGADDYLVKPFEFRELLARVKVLVRKPEQLAETVNVLVVGDLELDLEKKVAHRGNTYIELTAKEFSLLEYFMRNSGRVLSRIDIAEKVWDIKFDFGTNVVDVYVNFLRKKIDKGHDKKMIHTRVGFGYVFGDF